MSTSNYRYTFKTLAGLEPLLEKELNEAGCSKITTVKRGFSFEADEAMMQWMAEFKVPEEEGARKTYLINEKTKIQNVSDQMYTSMAAATLLLDSLKTLKQQ